MKYEMPDESGISWRKSGGKRRKRTENVTTVDFDAVVKTRKIRQFKWKNISAKFAPV